MIQSAEPGSNVTRDPYHTPETGGTRMRGLWRRLFTRTRAVVVIDMAGFTSLTQEQGIGAALREIAQFRRTVRLWTWAFGGRVVKEDADNVFCTFRSVPHACVAARNIVGRTNASAGVGYGAIYLPPGDLWGDEVNKASRLGEDVAEHGQVLLTDAAKGQWSTER
jgi:class 3 adenylate cyclase